MYLTSLWKEMWLEENIYNKYKKNGETIIIFDDLTAFSSKPNIDTFYSKFVWSQQEAYAFCYFHSKLCGKHLQMLTFFWLPKSKIQEQNLGWTFSSGAPWIMKSGRWRYFYLKNLSAPRSVWMWYWEEKSVGACCWPSTSPQLIQA
jgi:hypothetical protein